ncbi:MAG: hypothetical protein AABX13_01875 [Nanoarchaeota archaeon]
MDVERIQKINSMALELLKKGMASDREDAVKQAELFYKDLSGDTAALRIGGKESTPGSVSSVIAEKSTLGSGSAPQTAALTQEKLNEIMEKNTQFIVKTFKGFQEKIQALEGEVSSLKQKMLFSRPAPSSAPAASSSSSAAAAKPAGAESQAHPRTGSYKQEEVSIEKYFYMGGKR